MAIMQNLKKFDDYKKKLLDAQGAESEYQADPRFLATKVDNTYRGRLIYWESEDPKCTRKGPFQEIWIHSSKDSDNKYHSAICPTTLFAKSGFKKCKCCTANSDFYKSTIKADQELYRAHKRKLHCYALFLVVNDPTNPDNNGHVKILHYGKKIKTFFDSEIYEIKQVAKNTDGEETPPPVDDTGEAVGKSAFDLQDGYDLIIAVTKDGEYNNYTPKFARKATAINVDIAKLEAEIKALNFDGGDLITNIDCDTDSYFDKYVAAVRGSSTPFDSTPPVNNNVEVSSIEDLAGAASELMAEEEKKVAPVKPVEKPVEKVVKKAEKPVEKVTVKKIEKVEEPDEINDFLNGIESELEANK